MSQILRARDRLLSKSKSIAEVVEEEQKDKKLPRKFRLSSLSHNFDAKQSKDSSPLIRRLNLNQTHSVNMAGGKDSARGERQLDSTTGKNFRRATVFKMQQNRAPFSPVNLYNKQVTGKNEGASYMVSPILNLNQKPFHTQPVQLILTLLPKRVHQSPFKPRECERAYVEQVVRQTKNTQHCFVDSMFPPARTILFNNRAQHQEGLKFQRISRLFDCALAVIKYSQPTSLTMSKYSNPFLYSALTMLSEQPSNIVSLVGSQQINEEGIYYVSLCLEGVWRYVLIDDFLPIKHGKCKQYLSLHSREKNNVLEVWPSLVQKAVAKVYGNYLNLSAATEDGILPFMKILTGLPVSQYAVNKDFRTYLILIDSALKRKHIVVLEGIHEDKQQSCFLKGLSLHQGYKIIGIKKHHIVLRNVAENELVTKITFEQALLFTRLLVFRNDPGYIYHTYKLRHRKQYYSKVILQLHSTSKCYWDVWENNPAYYRKSTQQYHLSPYQIRIRNTEELQVVESGKQIQLKEGIYEINVHLCQAKQQDFTLSYYGEKEVVLERVKNMDLWKEKCFCNND